MRIPRKFTLKGKMWRVRYKAALQFEGVACDGLCNYSNRTITINQDLSKKERQDTFLHELFHAIIFEAHINRGTKFTEGLEEILCDAFADALTTLFNVRWRK
jgi:Zn-dependent peptidase ImmA (M78 family)